MSEKNRQLVTDEPVEFDTRATPGGPVKNISPTYSPEIQGWDFVSLEVLVARLPPFSQSLQ